MAGSVRAFLYSQKRTANYVFSTSSRWFATKRVVFLGTPEVAASSLKKIHEASQKPESDFDIVGVVTQPPKRRQRKKKPQPTPVGLLAEDLGLPILCPEKANSKEFLDDFAENIRPDLCITAAYGQYLPKRFLATPSLGTVNIHPSLLPRWRGASPVQRSLEAGDNPVGVSVLYTVSAMDAGPIISQKEETVDENDTATTVLPLLFDVGTDLLLEKLSNILDGTQTIETATAQDDDMAVAAALIHSTEGELKPWEESAVTCHNRCRGFSMWPATYLFLQVGDREPMKVKVLETKVVDASSETPDDVVRLGPTKKSGLYVTCFDGSVLELVTVQPATRKAFRARDFQNGYPGEKIMWVRTPDDQANDPEKYNSRKSKDTPATARQ